MQASTNRPPLPKQDGAGSSPVRGVNLAGPGRVGVSVVVRSGPLRTLVNGATGTAGEATEVCVDMGTPNRRSRRTSNGSPANGVQYQPCVKRIGPELMIQLSLMDMDKPW